MASPERSGLVPGGVHKHMKTPRQTYISHTITPGFNINIATAAPSEIPTSKSVGRVCGSVFASATISALTAATSPLISIDNTDTNPQGEDAKESIQPSTPNPIQTKTYNEFCRSIWDAVTEQGFSRLPGNFSFSCQEDDGPGVSVTGGFATQMDEVCESIAKMKTRSVAEQFYKICD